jgi:hypothetical protein
LPRWLKTESSGHPDGELLHVPGTDCPARGVLPDRGRAFWRAAFSDLGIARLWNVSSESWSTVKLLWTTIWHAVVVWGMIAPVFVGLLYVMLTPVLRRALGGQNQLPA